MDLVIGALEGLTDKCIWLTGMSRDAIKKLPRIAKMNHVFAYNHMIDVEPQKKVMFIDCIKEAFETTPPTAPIQVILGKEILMTADVLSYLDKRIEEWKIQLDAMQEGKAKEDLTNRYILLSVYRASIQWRAFRSKRPKFGILRRMIESISKANLMLWDLCQDEEQLNKLLLTAPIISLVLIVTMLHKKQTTNRRLLVKLFVQSAEAAESGLYTNPDMEGLERDLMVFDEKCKTNPDLKLGRQIGSSATIRMKGTPTEVLQEIAKKVGQAGYKAEAKGISNAAGMISVESDIPTFVDQLCKVLQQVGKPQLAQAVENQLIRFVFGKYVTSQEDAEAGERALEELMNEE